MFYDSSFSCSSVVCISPLKRRIKVLKYRTYRRMDFFSKIHLIVYQHGYLQLGPMETVWGYLFRKTFFTWLQWVAWTNNSTDLLVWSSCQVPWLSNFVSRCLHSVQIGLHIGLPICFLSRALFQKFAWSQRAEQYFNWQDLPWSNRGGGEELNVPAGQWIIRQGQKNQPITCFSEFLCASH